MIPRPLKRAALNLKMRLGIIQLTDVETSNLRKIAAFSRDF